MIQLVSHYSSLSRRLKDNWQGKVYRQKTGKVLSIDPVDDGKNKRLVLPPLPRVRKQAAEKLTSRNKAQIDKMPWTLGLVEAMGAVEVVTRQKFHTKNRMALILLDSNFEISLKEFIVHRQDLFPVGQFNDAAIRQLFRRRQDVINAVSSRVTIPSQLLDKAAHYYNARNKLIHERATVEVTDVDIDNYRSTVERILKILFGLKF